MKINLLIKFFLMVAILCIPTLSQITIHILNPWARDTARTKLYIQSSEAGWYPGTAMIQEPGNWYQYTFNNTVVTSGEEFRIVSVIPTPNDAYANKETITISPLNVIFKGHETEKEIWIVMASPTDKPTFSFQPPPGKILFFFNPWEIGAPWLLYKEQAIKMRWDSGHCGWFSYTYAGDVNDAVFKFKNSLNKLIYSADGAGDGGVIDLTASFAAHDTVYILPTPQPAGPPKISFTFPGIMGNCAPLLLATTVRDKKQGPNSDFFPDSVDYRVIKKIAGEHLGVNGKPVPGDSAVLGKGSRILTWFLPDTAQGYPIEVCSNIQLSKNEDNLYAYESDQFFPADSMAFLDDKKTVPNPDYNLIRGTDDKDHNYLFTMELQAQFEYIPGQTFYFRGDDDVWVFIDSELVVDIGGIHGPSEGSVALDTLGLTEGKTYSFNLFFAERQPQGSNFKIITSINLRSDVELFSKITQVDKGISQWDMFEQIMTNSYSCQRTADTVYNKAVIEYYLEGAGLEGINQLFAGTSFGGITISPDLSTIVIDTSRMSLSAGNYRIRYNLRSDKSKGDTIFFTLTGLPFKPDNNVVKAAAFADGGDGKVNRFEVHYERELEALPDSLHLSWPSGSVSQSFFPSSMKPDSTDKKHITIVVSDDNRFNTYATVAKEPAPKGTSFFYDTLYKKQRTVSFPISDSIGPLITSATLIERETDGMDTILITLSEEVDVSLLLGKSCLLTKSDGKNVELYVVSAIKTNGKIQIIIKSEGTESPQKNDSLRLNSTSLFQDLTGNRVNPKNRPVALALIEKPGKIIAAFYKDLNADGRVDNVNVTFDKDVNVDSISVFISWLGETAIEVPKSQISFFGNSRKQVLFSLPESVSYADRTSGNMEIRFIFHDVNGFTRLSAVTDSAAAVLVSASLFPGSGTTLSEKQSDTLIVVFSEPIATIGNISPFVFIQHKKNVPAPVYYHMQLRELMHNDRSWSFIIRGIDSVITYPLMTDSVYIDTTAMITDLFSNVQKNPENKRIHLVVKPVPYEIKTLLGPNPFNPDEGQILSLRLVPTTEIKSQVMLQVKIVLYDQLGNRIFAQKKESDVNSSTTAITFSWNGRNRNQRLVGSGTYLLAVVIQDLISGTIKNEFIKGIGVKRLVKNDK